MSKKPALVVTLMLLAASTLSSCTEKAPTNKISASEEAAEKALASGNAAAAAQEYARIGEMLLLSKRNAAERIKLAQKMFNKALQIDSNNALALLYRPVTQVALTLAGFPARFEKVGNILNNNMYSNGLRSRINGADETNKFLLTGNGEGILDQNRTDQYSVAADAQKDLRDRMIPALAQATAELARLERTLGDKNSMELAKGLVKNEPVCIFDKKGLYACSAEEENDNNARLKVDANDIKLARASFGFYLTILRVSTAYSLEGYEKAIRKINTTTQRTITEEDFTEILRQQSNLLTLVDASQLNEALSSLEDHVRDGIRLGEMEDELCSAKNPRAQGRHLFSVICMSTQILEGFRSTSTALAGPVQIKLKNESSDADREMTTLDLAGFLKNAPRDLKDLLPTSFNDHGYATTFPDLTLAGLFPDKLTKYDIRRGQISGRFMTLLNQIANTIEYKIIKSNGKVSL